MCAALLLVSNPPQVSCFRLTVPACCDGCYSHRGHHCQMYCPKKQSEFILKDDRLVGTPVHRVSPTSYVLVCCGVGRVKGRMRKAYSELGGRRSVARQGRVKGRMRKVYYELGGRSSVDRTGRVKGRMQKVYYELDGRRSTD